MLSYEFSVDSDKLEEELGICKEKLIDGIYSEAKDICPVDTGYMLSTITKEDDGVSVGANYSPYTNYRTGWFDEAVQRAVSKL